MSYKFFTSAQVENLPDEQNDNAFEVVMPEMNLGHALSSMVDETVSLAGSVPSLSGFSKWSPIVEEINFTPRSFKTNTGRIRSQWINFASDLENMQTARITMFCSQNMLTQYYLNAWYSLIYNEAGEYFYEVNNYKRDIHVYFYGSSLSSLAKAATLGVGSTDYAIAAFVLRGAFPIKQESYKLKYSKDPKRLTLSVDFAYDKLVPERGLAQAAINSEALSSLTGFANLLHLFGSLDESYDIKSNY